MEDFDRKYKAIAKPVNITTAAVNPIIIITKELEVLSVVFSFLGSLTVNMKVVLDI